MRSLFLAAVAALCFLTISVCPAVTSAVVEDLNGPLGPDDEQLGVGGDDDSPTQHVTENPPTTIWRPLMTSRDLYTVAIEQPQIDAKAASNLWIGRLWQDVQDWIRYWK